MFNDFLANYGMELLYTIIVGIAGYIGIAIKRLIQRVADDRTKESIAKTVVRAVQQLYKDLNGEEKLIKATENIAEMLADKNILINDLEIRMLIEAAVRELNNEAMLAFHEQEAETAKEYELDVEGGII